jgi:protein involved in polysaccharide export with SLBB domain
MTVLDAMIAVGGLTRYAAGNDSVIIRSANGAQNTYAVHLSDLIRDGDIASNVALQPGDILIFRNACFKNACFKYVAFCRIGFNGGTDRSATIGRGWLTW